MPRRFLASAWEFLRSCSYSWLVKLCALSLTTLVQNAFLPPHVSFFSVSIAVRTSMRDGSITVANSIEAGARLQLFVRDR